MTRCNTKAKLSQVLDLTNAVAGLDSVASVEVVLRRPSFFCNLVVTLGKQIVAFLLGLSEQVTHLVEKFVGMTH